MTQKIQIQSHSSGTVLGLKWYWWLIIVVGFIVITGGLSSILGGSKSLGSKLAQAVLGFAAGVLSALSKSPLAWFFAIIFLGPIAFRGACGFYKTYKEHFAKGKTNEDTCKELGLSPEDFQKQQETLEKQIKTEQDKIQAIKEQTKSNYRLLQDKNYERYQTKIQDAINEGNITEANRLVTEYNTKDAENAKEAGIEPKPHDPVEEG